MEPTITGTNKKYEILKNIFPESVKQVNFAVVDLDISLLSVADILRNINRNFPANTANRNAIANGSMAVAVLCRSKYLAPVKGVIIIVMDDGAKVNIRSRDYIVMGVSENTINSNDKILDMLDKFTTYLVQNFAQDVSDFEKFYTLYVYDAYEMDDN